MRKSRATTAACVVGAAMMAATACGSSTAVSGTPSSSAATVAASANKPFGLTITSATGAMYTVLALQAVQPKRGTNTPNPGGAYFAANVQECAAGGPALTTDPTAWMAVFSGNEQAQGRDARDVVTAGPPLATGAILSPGVCAAGWVAFTAFADSIPREVHLTGLSSGWIAP